MRNSYLIFVVFVLLGACSSVHYAVDIDSNEPDTHEQGSAVIDVSESDLSSNEDIKTAELDGGALFQLHCAGCHGSDGKGTSIAPGLIEEVFKEDGDELVEVILEGEDDMPPILVSEDVAWAIVAWMKSNLIPENPDFYEGD